MISPRLSGERGHLNYGWLDTFHTFSFGDYADPLNMGFRCLRVINEDFIEPRGGFPLHSHHDMEILTYLISGRLAHLDDMGNESLIEPGQMQRMSAGSGIRHSESNPSESERTHLLQIWILPSARGVPPSYETRSLAGSGDSAIRLVASPDARDGSLSIGQDVTVHKVDLVAEGRATHELRPERYAWLHVLRGSLSVVGDTRLAAGDGASVEGLAAVDLVAGATGVEAILFDLP